MPNLGDSRGTINAYENFTITQNFRPRGVLVECIKCCRI